MRFAPVAALLVILLATTSQAALRKTIASGAWSNQAVWENGVLPEAGADVLITAGTELTLDIITPVLSRVTVDGTLNGATGELRISTAFATPGVWLPQFSKVTLVSVAAVSIDAAWPPEYYDLTLADSSMSAGPRSLKRDIIVHHDLWIDFAADTSFMSGTGSAEIAHNLLYRGGSADGWTGVIRFVSDPALAHDTSFFTASLVAHGADEHFVFPRVSIEKRDSSIVRLGRSRLDLDTMWRSESADTIIEVRSGWLDLQSGWISLTDPVVPARPIIAVSRGARLRLATPLPIYDGGTPSSIYDSLHTPRVALDTNSTVEYYSYSSDVIDASYLTNNLIGGDYQNLTIGSNAIASFWANPVTVRGKLAIEFGATIKPNHKKVFAAGPAEQVLTLYGDVRNAAPGPDGADGFYGGIVSLGTDRWIFASDRTDGGKDSLHWSGPSQLGSVVVRSNVVLDVRHVSDTAFDSLDILNTLVEEGKPCGAHVLGTVYSEVPVDFSTSHPSDSLHGFGLTIDAARQPYPTRVRVARTTGYRPPGADSTSKPILRYYATYAAGGLQLDSSTLHADFHCDELEGSDPGRLSLWRSREKRGAWVYLGPAKFVSAEHAMVWQTSSLYPDGTSRPYYWMFAEGYRDTPTPVELLSFSASPQSNGVSLNWITASEFDLSGFEIVRHDPSLEGASARVTVARWDTDAELRAKSGSGAHYEFLDPIADTGLRIYDLYEHTIEGARSRIATRTVDIGALPVNMQYSSGILRLPAGDGGELRVYDVAGREVSSRRLSTETSVSLNLRHGAYLAVLTRGGVQMMRFLAEGNR